MNEPLFKLIVFLVAVQKLVYSNCQQAFQFDDNLSTVEQSRVQNLELKVSLLMKDIERLKKFSSCQQCNSIEFQEHAEEADNRRGAAPRSHSRRLGRALADDQRQANFFRGERGPAGLDGLPGLDGAPGLDGVPGRDGRNGKDGKDGLNGKDGRDGQPGERGPLGPLGPQGEPGRRGKQGPPGKPGLPGPAGVCAYRAKFNCQAEQLMAATGGPLTQASAGSREDLNNLQALLMAPTMVGQQADLALQDEERQVSVNEGDHIQLSCAAFGLPKPIYLWRRAASDANLMLEAGANWRSSSYPGSQLPLASVDRLQSGGYECLASNGVPPDAIKRINLDVNYAPTVRLYPGPSRHRLPLGSSLFIECLTEANPSSFSYWTFGATSLMSVAPFQQQQQQSAPPMLSLPANRFNSKYVITESTGQLATGASYTLLSLNITSISRDDLGLYKCVSKNLVGQSIGYVWLDTISTADAPSLEGFDADRKFRGAIEAAPNERLERALGWPSYLMERELNYSTFGDEARRQRLKSSSLSSSQLDGRNSFGFIESASVNSVEVAQTKSQTASKPPLISINADQTTAHLERVDEELRRAKHKSAPLAGVTSTLANYNGINQLTLARPNETKRIHTAKIPAGFGSIVGDELVADEMDLCRNEKSSTNSGTSNTDPIGSMENTNTTQLLDQVGKPVYVGSATANWLSWWSFNSELRQDNNNEQTNDELEHRCYATSANITNQLFIYANLTYLLGDQYELASEKQQISQKSRTLVDLSIPMSGNSHLIYGSHFLYLSVYSNGGIAAKESPQSVKNRLQLVALNLDNNALTVLRLDGKISPQFNQQPLDLGSDFKLNRAELAADENGIWLILPTVEQKNKLSGGGKQVNRQEIDASTQEDLDLLEDDEPTQLTRRLHVMKIKLINSNKQAEDQVSNNHISIEYHVSMRLDWRMIGQIFIIDGVLYGIKDRHLYSSKLQFAYDLYKCKLLSTEYLNEPHRTFTNHFGNTQMISYNPNKPKRLYTIDNGNLLWCPVKLIKTNPEYIRQPNHMNNDNSNKNGTGKSLSSAQLSTDNY